MPILIEVDEIADGWETLVKEIMKNGKDVNDERGSLTKEILNVMVSIKKNHLARMLEGISLIFNLILMIYLI